MATEADLDAQRKAFALLRAALEIETGSREEWIERHCGDDPALADAVRRLLAGQPQGLLDEDARAVAARLVAQDEEEPFLPPGSRIGEWTVLAALAHGGMGSVHLAERSGDGFRQRGALKLIKRGMDSSAVLARFRRERQILSRLEHPHIARLLDGGMSADGRPWFVMEYVEGLNLRQWLVAEEPGLDRRIEVFLQLGAALAHAHQHLVVHRDIKPENVMVGPDGNARLLDFGIAKLLEDDATDATRTRERFVSRAYAAPEQIEGEDATTATDVYQLGVLLFEMLTGARFDRGHTQTSGSSWLTRATPLDGDRTRRRIPAARLRGDAGIIVARAIDADPGRRYATIEAFCADVRAWREGRPITARPDTFGYRLRRFVGRHRVASAAVLVALGAILAGSSLAFWQARKAAEEARVARAAQAFLSSVFEASAPDAAAGERVTARELLDRASQRIDGELADQPRLRGEMQLTLGRLYAQLGQYPQAAALLTAARATLATGDGATWAGLELAGVLRELDQLDEAAALIEPALDTRDPALQGRARIERALVQEAQGRMDAALTDARTALRIDLARGTTARAEQARDRQTEALLLARNARFDEAATAFDQAIAIASAVHGDRDTRVAQMRNDYAVALVGQGRASAAEAQLRMALEVRRERLGNDHPAVAETLQVLGGSLRQQARLDDADAALEEALRIQRQVFGERHPVVANTLNSLGMLEFARRHPAEAEARFREALSIWNALDQGDTPGAATTANNLASVLLQSGRYDEAEPLSQHALDVHLKLLGEHHPVVMSDLNSLAQLELRRGKLARALAYSERAIAIVDAGAVAAREGAYVRLAWANLLAHAARSDEALTQIDKVIAALGAIDANEPRLTLASAVRADALLGLQRFDEAEALAREVLARRKQAEPSDPASIALAHALLARIARARHDLVGERRERADVQAQLTRIAHPDAFLLDEIERP